MYNKEEIERILRDYHWMVREISRLRSALDDAGEGITAQYGVDMVMPKGRGGTSDPVHMEVARREKQWQRILRMENKIKYIQDRIDCVTDERERTVLDCMLDGMSISVIARHMGMSERHVFRIKSDIVYRMSEMSVLSGMSGKLRKSKVPV